MRQLDESLPWPGSKVALGSSVFGPTPTVFEEPLSTSMALEGQIRTWLPEVDVSESSLVAMVLSGSWVVVGVVSVVSVGLVVDSGVSVGLGVGEGVFVGVPELELEPPMGTTPPFGSELESAVG